MSTFADRIAEDHAKFFNLSDFGTSVSYTPFGGSASTIKVFWEENFSEVNPNSGYASIQGKQVLALCRTSDVSAATDEDTIVKDAVTWKVIEVRPNGDRTGLILSRD